MNRERVKEGGDVPLLRSGMHLIRSLCLAGAIAVWGTAASLATEQPSDVPAWLRSHIGEGEGQIAQMVLQRARALYLKKVAAGVVGNPCYFAMDATRPRWQIGEAVLHDLRSSPVVSRSRHGSWQRSQRQGCRRTSGTGRECAKNFGNALDSYLTTGGAYVTAETRTLFKGYYRSSAKQDAVLMRSFVQFDGEGETANARERDIGGHPAVLLRQIRYRWMPRSPYANENGCIPVGTLEDYAGGRSNGCTSWSRLGRRTDHSIAQGSDDALHLSEIPGRQGGCASRLGSPSRICQTAIIGTPSA